MFFLTLKTKKWMNKIENKKFINLTLSLFEWGITKLPASEIGIVAYSEGNNEMIH